MSSLFPALPDAPVVLPLGPVVLAASGHRPPRLGLDYGPAGNRCLTRFAHAWLAGFLERQPVACVWSDLELGWGQAFAHAAVLCGVELRAVVIGDQSGGWDAGAVARYDALLTRAAEVVRLGPGRRPGRAGELTDRAGLVVALWDGRECHDCAAAGIARALDRPVLNVWAEWLRWERPASRWAGPG